MKEVSTEIVLEKILNSKSLEDVSKAMENTSAKFDKSFQDFFNEYLNENPELKVAEIIKDSDIDKTYAYQMINGTKTSPGRDYVISLCYASRMNLEDVNHALIYTGNSPLHPKIKRDACIIYAFKNNAKSKRVTTRELNETLCERNFELLKPVKGSR